MRTWAVVDSPHDSWQQVTTCCWPQKAGLRSVSDARLLAWAVAAGRLVLTRDHEDFADLHDLVLAVGGSHPGILVVRFDNDPRNNLIDAGIASAMTRLEASGVMIPNQIHVLNHWR